jgi:hypothetical protein
MSWLITGVGVPPYDPDAAAYIAAVEAADQQSLEDSVKYTIDQFVRGCKADGIWDAIKASCILAGARTRLGALTPLVGTAPTSFNFVDGDYNRKTGLVGNGSTKYLNSNRNNNADPQDNSHLSVWVTTAPPEATTQAYIGAAGIGANQINTFPNSPFPIVFRQRTASAYQHSKTRAALGLIGASRSNSSNYIARADGASETATFASETPLSVKVLVFARNSDASVPGVYTDARLAFYSIGESLDLALLDARVTDLINAFAAAIPS